MASETIHEFELQGCHFYIVWKPGMALLRVIESYSTPDQCHYTVADLFAELYDGSPDYEMTREEAIKKGPLTAEVLLIRNRMQEAPMMENLYNSLEVQAQYPVYLCRELQAGGENYPFVWGSHNCNSYVRFAGEWLFSGWATSLDESQEKARRFVSEKSAVPSVPKVDNQLTASTLKPLSNRSATVMQAVFSFMGRWQLVLFLLAYITIILTLGWFGYQAAVRFCQWFLLICLALWDLYMRLTCKSVPTGRGSDFTPSLVDRLTFRECGLTLMFGLFLPIPVWLVALVLASSFSAL